MNKIVESSKQYIDDYLINYKYYINTDNVLTLAEGLPGLAILCVELKDIIDVKEFYIYRNKIVNEIIKELNKAPSITIGLWSGLCGVNTALLSMNCDGKLNAVIEDIHEKIKHETNMLIKNYQVNGFDNVRYGEYDLLSGMSGILRYFVFAHKNKLQVKESDLTQFITYFNKLIKETKGIPNYSIKSENSIGNLKQFFPFGGTIIGAAHGICSVINSLLMLENFKEVDSKEVQSILDSLTKKIHNSYKYDEGLPIVINENHEYSYSINGSWCYGVPGIIPNLINYAIKKNDNEKYDTCIDLHNQLLSSKYEDLINTESDILCHGKAGLLYYSIYMESKHQIDSSLLNEKMIKQLNVKFQSDKFTDTPDREGDPPVVNYGLLNGKIGVYLALLSVNSKQRFKDDWILF